MKAARNKKQVCYNRNEKSHPNKSVKKNTKTLSNKFFCFFYFDYLQIQTDMRLSMISSISLKEQKNLFCTLSDDAKCFLYDKTQDKAQVINFNFFLSLEKKNKRYGTI
ncbi:hypothetical protein RFI_39937 [Reticulomyxa filosa]|uniref:Uncharacterized protein n=1 Tax=Reticulomyxa filosa TaxID=46433 RepID=X6L784_RETFI|nr:hypothetical protein RFI_39937 [Reticulomyxa filosa]|eukprot:ETN97592.1 hypothetical protein RFI_39937 [Reticulomyxa filosa]